MTSPWETEEESPEEKELEYQAKAHIVLEDSDTETWGVVRDTEGVLDRKPGDGPVIGSWSKSPVDNCYHAFLQTPIMALADKATQKYVELAAKRVQGYVAPTRRSKPREALVPDVPSEATVAIGNLRKNLQGG